MAETKTEQSHEGRLFFYYPGPTKGKKRRVVLAGIVEGNQILVSEAVLFPGKKTNILDEREVSTEEQGDLVALMVKPGVPSDIFNKRLGRGIALDKCRGFYYNVEKTKPGVDYINGTYKDQAGVVHKLTPKPCERKIVLTINIPKGEEYVGRLFVSEVTKIYPPKPKKPEATFTLTQVNDFLISTGGKPVSAQDIVNVQVGS